MIQSQRPGLLEPNYNLKTLEDVSDSVGYIRVQGRTLCKLLPGGKNPCLLAVREVVKEWECLKQ